MISRWCALSLSAALLIAACAPASPSAVRPDTEFLVVSDDSTAWVRASADSVIVHRAPMMIAILAGRLIEIFVSEEPIVFDDATFLATRVFRRDLATGDSTLVFADSTVLREAMAFVRAHPTAERLDPDDAPETSARALESTVTPLDVVGHTLGVDVHVDRTVGELGTHDTYRATIDLRDGRRLVLGDVIAPNAASAAVRVARQNLRDAVLLASQRVGPVGKAASRAMAALTLDSLSFGLVRSGDSLAVQFLAHDEQVIDDARDGHRFSLEPMPVPPPDWWSRARSTLPKRRADSTSFVSLGAATLQLHDDADEVATITLSSGRIARRIAQLRGPVRRVIPLSDSLITPAVQWRRALERAFRESGYYSAQVRAASLRSRARPTAAIQAAL